MIETLFQIKSNVVSLPSPDDFDDYHLRTPARPRAMTDQPKSGSNKFFGRAVAALGLAAVFETVRRLPGAQSQTLDFTNNNLPFDLAQAMQIDIGLLQAGICVDTCMMQPSLVNARCNMLAAAGVAVGAAAGSMLVPGYGSAAGGAIFGASAKELCLHYFRLEKNACAQLQCPTVFF